MAEQFSNLSDVPESDRAPAPSSAVSRVKHTRLRQTRVMEQPHLAKDPEAEDQGVGTRTEGAIR